MTTMATPLGRAIASPVPVSPPVPPHEAQARSNSLRDVILGGQDGLVNMLGIALGVISAGGSTHILVATSLTAAITESISMGAVAYTSFGSERDYYRAAQAKEKEEVEAVPELERQEVREIYAAKGFDGELLERVVAKITENRDVWVKTMMEEELHLEPVATSSIVRSAFIVTLATLIGHFIPLAPFTMFARTPAIVLAVVLSGLALFGVGAYSALTLIGDWRKSGLQMLLIGLGAAGLGFLIGLIFHTSGA